MNKHLPAAKKFLSDRNYGTGTNITTGAAASLIADFAELRINDVLDNIKDLLAWERTQMNISNSLDAWQQNKEYHARISSDFLAIAKAETMVQIRKAELDRIEKQVTKYRKKLNLPLY